MINFTFAVLGSGIFWVLYFALSFFVGTVLLKKLAPRTFRYITSVYVYSFDEFDVINDEFDVINMIFILPTLFIFWPIVLIVGGLYLLVKHIFWGGFCEAVKKIDASMPEIVIKDKE